MKITKKQRENLITVAIAVTPLLIAAIENAPLMNEVLKYWLIQIGAVVALVLRVLFVNHDNKVRAIRSRNVAKSSPDTRDHVCDGTCRVPCPKKQGAHQPPGSGGR